MLTIKSKETSRTIFDFDRKRSSREVVAWKDESGEFGCWGRREGQQKRWPEDITKTSRPPVFAVLKLQMWKSLLWEDRSRELFQNGLWHLFLWIGFVLSNFRYLTTTATWERSLATAQLAADFGIIHAVLVLGAHRMQELRGRNTSTQISEGLAG